MYIYIYSAPTHTTSKSEASHSASTAEKYMEKKSAIQLLLVFSLAMGTPSPPLPAHLSMLDFWLIRIEFIVLYIFIYT